MLMGTHISPSVVGLETPKKISKVRADETYASASIRFRAITSPYEEPRASARLGRRHWQSFLCVN